MSKGINMSNEAVFLLRDDTIECLYKDDLGLQDIGTLRIGRASNIEFNNDTQLWDVHIDGEVKHSHAERSQAIEWEVDYFQSKLKRGETICHTGQN
jgi:hypothetical protein